MALNLGCIESIWRVWEQNSNIGSWGLGRKDSYQPTRGWGFLKVGLVIVPRIELRYHNMDL